MSQVPVSLTRLKLPSKIVVKGLHADCLNAILTETLKELGLVVMEECPVFLSLHPAIIDKFVHPPSPQGVLQAMIASPSTIKENIQSAKDEGKRSLRNLVSKVSSLKPEEKQLLCCLSLFETLSKSFVSKEIGVCAAPEGPLPAAPCRDLIDINHDDSKRLAHMLDIRILSPSDFLLEEVFPGVKGGKFSGEEIDRLMAFVMERYQVYAGADYRFEDAMKYLPFVSTNSGRVRAMDLFDPKTDLLRGIFANEDVFPVGEQYTDPTVLVVLQRLGLKSEDKVSARDLYISAKKIAEMSSISTTEKKSEAIMSYLHSNPGKLQENVSGTALGLLLQDIPWVSVLRQKPRGFPGKLHFYGEKENEGLFYKPTEVTSEDKVNLIGTVKAIVKVASSSHLAKCLGWDKIPDLLDVMQHFQTVITCYTQEEKVHYIAIVKDIYSFLSGIADPARVGEALQGIKNSSWIWNGDGFSSPNSVLAEKPSIDLSPYICSLPSEVQLFSNFFSKFGMREHCDALFLLEVLHMIKEKYKLESGFPKSEVTKDLQLSVNILNEVKPKVGEQLPSELQEKVLIPTHVEGDSYVKLEPVEHCMYCEHEWLEGGSHDEEMDFLYVHPNIPNSTAELLGVPTLMNRMLEPDEMQIGDEFGQEEKLTRRLNRLLEDYTDGFSVPKELIQNADDAGATEVRFLYDERTNEDAMTCLIDEGMKECQGPALWVYNDAEFRDEDFVNITKLNGGTKEQETEKIGKFGLGFNAVYNLTDVPMFLSRNYFVIFDPNTFYLGKAIKGKPGMKIDTNKNTKKLRNFRNQFKPFNGVFGCDLHLNKQDNSFQGTLFRFPLRTKEQAVRSEIKQVHYDNSQIRDLLYIFVRGAKTLLLFTQNVRQVSIFHLPRDSTERTQPDLIFEMTKSLSQSGILREVAVPVSLPSALKNLSKADEFFLKQSNFLRASSEVAKRIGDAGKSRTELLRSAFTINIRSTITECGSAFFQDKGHLDSASEVWLVASSMGKGQAMQFSENEKNLLPSAGVAVQLKPKDCEKFVPSPVVNQTIGRGTHHNGTLFCYLPLPIHSGLPIHINGAFAVASSRRRLKEKTEDDKACLGVEWNNVLLKDSVCAAYLDLLEDVKSACDIYSFHSLWPRACDVEQNCESLARSFYQKVASGGYSLFSDGDRWVDINQVVFLEPAFRQEPQVGDISFSVLQMLFKGNEVIVDLPAVVFQSFVEYGLAEKLQSKLYDKSRFFHEIFFPNIASVPPVLRDSLVLYALDEGTGKFDELVKAYPCIPASPDGQTLKSPGQLVNPLKAGASLFSGDDGRFPFGSEKTFMNSLRLVKLEQLGMMADDPPWEMFAERAESISILNEVNNDAASKRTKALIELLARKLNSGQTSSLPGAVQNSLVQAKFLPVATKPTNFPLSWKGETLQHGKEGVLISPKQAFMAKKKYLVCCSEPVVDLFIPSVVQTFLLLDKKQATLEHVETQLHVASSSNAQSLNFSEFEEVRHVCLTAYKYLQEALNEKKMEENDVREMFQEKKLILAGREFVNTKQVAFDLAVDCSPYLHKLSDDLARPFHSLMKTAGVKEAFEDKDFITCLQAIKMKFGDTELDKMNVQAAVSMACQLGECLKGFKDGVQHFPERTEVIYLPDSYGIMRPASELCISDCFWLIDETDIYFAHGGIPQSTSILLGVKTRREGALQRFAVGIPFGQKEKLTNRLQRILSAYPCEKEILKELLQNADDAEATEICFIKDPRQHSDERVFEDSWKPLQGPALCVYNNKPFTEADIQGIQNLGEGSKGDDPNKTGQYGVGFNAVYHLTDVPSFVSNGEEIGDVLCVFDPHCKYVPGANPREPGRMFRNTTKLKGMFPDVFSCYIEDQFPIQNSTMFRFPLRTEEMAKDSKISSSPVTLEDMEDMMESLKRELFEVLLFVNSVKKITLCDMDESGNVVNSYFVEAEISDENSAKRQQFASYLKQTAKTGEQTGVLPIDAKVKKCSYVLTLRDSNGKEETWFIVQQIGFENKVQTSIVDAYRGHDLGMLPRGGVACRVGDGSRVAETLERKKKAYCFLPLPVETNLPVHINGHFALDHEARRNLWRDETGGYRSDWNNALLQDVIASCYLTLLDEVRRFYQLPVTQTSEQATLSCSRHALANSIDHYEKIFPSAVSSNPYWAGLVTSVYQEMDRKRLRLLPVIRKQASEEATPKVQLTWLPPTGNGKDKAFFNNLGMADCFSANHRQLFNEKDEKRRIEKITSFEGILLETGFNLVAFSLSVCTALKNSGVKPSCVSPSAVMEFYKSFSSEDPLCRIGPISVDVAETPFKDAQVVALVLKYCKDDEQFLANLPGLPLLLTQDNHLHTFNAQDPKFLSCHHNILPQCKEMFVHEHVRTQIFGEAKKPKAPVFKRFDVDSFARSLHRTLPHQFFNSDGYVKWCPDQVALPNRDWLYRVWDFLYEESKNVLKKTDLSDKEKKWNIRAILEPLNNWCILPCTETFRPTKSRDGSTCSYSTSGVVTEHFLVPLRLAESVLDFTNHDATSYRLVEVLRVLRLAELNYVVISFKGMFGYTSGEAWLLARELVATLQTPTSLLTALNQKMTSRLHSIEGKLSPFECTAILQYFSDNVKHLPESGKNTLRRLPFYEATHGGLVSLNSKRVCVVPVEIPRNGMEVLESQVDEVFLKSWTSLSPLFQFLAFESVSPVDVYCKFILKFFYLFPQEARLVHLEFIRDSILCRKSLAEIEKKRLLICLTDTNILPSKDGTLKKASFYYDPENKVFRTMLTEEAFPRAPFDTPQWLTFFKTIGLVHEVSQELFKTFAMDVAREGATQRPDSAEEKSKVLVAHLFSREEVVDEGLLRAVCDIKFIPAYYVRQDLRAIHRQFGEGDHGQLPYISFKGSVLAKHAEIVWTTAAILPHWANPRKYQYQTCAPSWRSTSDFCNAILDDLQVLAEPTLDLVTFHCQNVSFQLEKENQTNLSPPQVLTRTSVMANIYRFLQSKAVTSTVTKERLKHTPCVLVEKGRFFVKAEQVVIELHKDDEIEPFLFRMPAELSEFKKLFQYLGCSPSVTPSHYAMVLDMLQKQCKTSRLDPNETVMALSAEKGLFEALRDHPKEQLGLSSLYLPAMCPFGSGLEDTAPPVVLAKAPELLFDDAPHYHDRIRNFDHLFVVDLKRANVRCMSSTNYRDLIMLLPIGLRPQMLSCVVEEMFADSKRNVASFDVGAASSLKKQLHSDQFCRGIIRLIRHACNERQEKLDDSVVASVKGRLQNIAFHGMAKLVTHLVYKGIVILGSEEEVPYYLEKICQSGQEIWNVYVNAVDDVEETLSAITLTLSQVISEACRGLLRDTAMFVPEMLRSKPGKIYFFLDKMKIRQDDSYDAERGDVLPSPGSFIPIAEHHLLNPAFKSFKRGEYVGYELEDPSLQMEEGDATFLYAVIIEEVPNGDACLFAKNYKINIGDEKEPKVVPATDLYKFYRLQEIVSTAIVPSHQQKSPESLNEKQAIFDEISRALEEAWRLPEERRRKVIKRLIFQWHPDKNPGNEEFCTEVFQHIINEIDGLEREGPADRNESRSSGSWYYHGPYSNFYGFWGVRAKHYTRQRQEYRDDYYRHYGSWSPGTRTWEVPPSFCRTNPQPREASRWFRQAEADLAAVVNDMNSGNPSYEWACFKCHQVRMQ